MYAATEDGKIHIINARKVLDSFKVCNNISKMRNCPYQPELIATGGKDRKNNLKIIDLTTKQITFSTKNIANDELDLEIPIWDTDFGFMSSTSISTCSRYGYIRFYDTRKQRRPIQSYKNDLEQISYNSMACYGDYIFVGSNLGVIRCFDTRSLKHVLHTYKGFVGSTTSLVTDATGNYLLVGGLDRYVRLYNVHSTELLYQCYTKSKVTTVLLQQVKKEEQNDKKLEQINAKKREMLEQDAEYEELFDKMQTVKDGDEQVRNTHIQRKTKKIK